MARGNLFLGLARGSVGDVTFYRRNAQQISRVRVRQVKNPQSPAQMYQRAINRTAVRAYGVVKAICDHSYEGISYGAESYAKFLSLNMAILRNELANEQSTEFRNRSFLPKDVYGMTAMPYFISRGSLPSFVVDGQIGGKYAEITPLEGVTLSAVAMFRSLSDVENATYQQVIDMLGAHLGDQVTIMRVKSASASGQADEPVGSEMVLARIILDPGSGNDPAETNFFDNYGAQGDFKVLRVNDPNPRNEGRAYFFQERASGVGAVSTIYATCGIETLQSAEDVGFCAILSRQREDGTWMRSSAFFAYNPLFRENGYTIKQASMLEPVEVVIENDYYLNNAE